MRPATISSVILTLAAIASPAIAVCDREAATQRTNDAIRAEDQPQVMADHASQAVRLCEEYAPAHNALATALEKLGTPIGANDLLIAAHARTLRAVCVTANLAEFSRVTGLKVENWLD